MNGKVYFIGAGPGDPELLTVKGKRIIDSAEVIIYTDSLVHPGLFKDTRSNATIHGSASLTLEEIVGIMVEAAQAGKTVARVHTGDPSLFGAVLEQRTRLEAEGVPYEIVPGVSSMLAAAALLKADLTVPELTQTVIVSRIEGRTPVPEGESLRDLARHGATLVLFLSAGRMRQVVMALEEGGYPADTPVAVVYRASWPEEHVVEGTLADIEERVRKAGVGRHALIMVGRVFAAELRRAPGPYRSRLYDRDFGHGFRRSAQVTAESTPDVTYGEGDDR